MDAHVGVMERDGMRSLGWMHVFVSVLLELRGGDIGSGDEMVDVVELVC